MGYEHHEVRSAPPRGRPLIPPERAERQLSRVAGHPISLPSGVVVHGGPTTCPACGSSKVLWGCDEEITLRRAQIHPLVWHETEWMADSFVCRDCNAGWIEPDEPEPITWVRPYWTIPDGQA